MVRLTAIAPLSLLWFRLFCDRDRAADDIQQRLRDDFIDTAWPACPDHAHHPLWFVDESWTCAKSGGAIAALGRLRRRR